MKLSRTSTQRRKNGDRAGRDLRRAFRHELRRLLRRASRDPGSGDIHAVRKGITKLRSWLRLVRGVISARQYHTHNRRLRKAARALAPLRDARVLLAAFETIASAAAFPKTSQRLSRRARRARKAAAAVMQKVKRRLARELAASDRLPLKKITAAELSIARVRMREEKDAAFAAAHAVDRVELWHAWRKRTKNYLHVFGFLAGKENPRYRTLARTNRLLGHEHDLALLESEVVARRQRAEQRALLAIIAAHRTKLRRRIQKASSTPTL